LRYPMIAGAEDLASMTWFATFPVLNPGTYTMHVDIAELNVHHATRFDVQERSAYPSCPEMSDAPRPIGRVRSVWC